MDQAVDRQLAQPAEKPEILDADDDSVKGLADSFLEVGEKLDSDQVAFGGLGPAFGARAVLAQGEQLVVVISGLSCRQASRSTGDGPADRDSGGSAK